MTPSRRGPRPGPAGRSVTALRTAAWRCLPPGRPVTPAALASAAGVTTGAAQSWLREWAAEGYLEPGNPPPGRYAPAALPYLPPNARYRVLVTGSRAWADKPALDAVLDAVRYEHPAALTVVHGACPHGADARADAWAQRNAVAVERWPADWARSGRSAGMRRNSAMVASRPAQCLAFIADGSPGASQCARAAEVAGIPTHRYEVWTAGGAAVSGCPEPTGARPG